MNYDDYLKTLTKLGKDEKTIQINLLNIIDPTILRSLGYINSEDDVDHYHIEGRQVVPLTIKLKKGVSLKEEDISFKRHGKQGAGL